MRLSLKMFGVVCMSAFVLVQFYLITWLSGPAKYPWEEDLQFKAVHKRTTTSTSSDEYRPGVIEEQGNPSSDHKTNTIRNSLDKPSNNNLSITTSDKSHSKTGTKQVTAPPQPGPSHSEPGTTKHDFTTCEPKGKDALSALQRAKTTQCKDKILETICLSQEDKIYNTSLKNECPIGRNPAKQFKYIPYKEGKGPGIRIVFLMSIHGRAVREVKRLFKAVYHTDHYYYIHVDYHSDYLYKELKNAFKKYPNVYFPEWRMATIWGGASLLQMLLKALEELEYKLADWKWDFFINLSESDFPLKTNEELVQFLRVQRRFNFVKTHGGDIKKFIQKQGLDRTFVECDYHMWRIGNRPLPHDITIDGGSDWIVINRNYSHYLVTDQSPFLNGLKKYYEYSLLPAESFFHTVLRNGKMCDTLVRSNLRVTNWNRKLGCRCQYKHIVDWCGCSPNNFLEKDLDKIKNPKDDQFFARKFEAIVNQHVINELDGHLYGHFPSDTPGLYSYWESLYHYIYDGKPSSVAHYTVYHSFMRITKDFISNPENWNQTGTRNEHQAQSTSDCASPGSNKLRISEVFVHYHEDRFVGYVARFIEDTAITSDESVTVYESLFLPNNNQVVGGDETCPKLRQATVEIGSNWDGKESIFRNYGGILGIYDQPALAIKLKIGRLCHLDITWINPLGIVEQRGELKLEASTTVTSQKLNLESPLMPGKWLLKITSTDNELFLEKPFIVFPVAFNKTGELLSQANLLNAKRITVLKPGMDQDRYLDWRINVMKNNDEGLDGWIDKLTTEQWQIKAACSNSVHSLGSSSSSSMNSNCHGGLIPSCKTLSWSSYYPDVKSELGQPDSNGRIR